MYAHHLRQGVIVVPVLRDARQVLDCRPECPHREDICDRIATLVGRAVDGIARARGTFIVPGGSVRRERHFREHPAATHGIAV